MILTHMSVGYADHPLKGHVPSSEETTVLAKGCFVGAGAIILPGVTVGECACVAAGSVVTRNVPPWTLVSGVRAKIIRSIGRPARDRNP